MITDLKTRSTHRLKIIKGQVEGLQRMIEAEDYCVDILTQSLAVQRSLRSLNKLLLENHLRTHVQQGLRSDDSVAVNTSVEELLKLYELSSVRGK